MPVELILAPPAAGKTAACIQRIQALRQTDLLAPVWVLVPDAQNTAYFRQRLARAGGGLGVNIGTFRALYTDLLERQGDFSPVITRALEHRLVQGTVDAAFAAGELAHYAAIRTKPGFIAALQDIFSELRSAYISPEQFATYTHNAPPAKGELAGLYTRFIAQLGAIKWIDRDGQIWAAIDILARDSQAAAHIHLLVVDGFNAFAGARLQFLKQLSTQVAEMLITLPGMPGSTRAVHRRTQPVIEALLGELYPQVTELTATPHLPPESRHLEQHVLDPGEYPKMEVSSSIFLAAQSRERKQEKRCAGSSACTNAIGYRSRTARCSSATWRPTVHCCARRRMNLGCACTSPTPTPSQPLQPWVRCSTCSRLPWMTTRPGPCSTPCARLILILP
jgi:hypothetical protein